MTDTSTGRLVDLDELWRPSLWKQRTAGKPLPSLEVVVVVGAIAWNVFANLVLPSPGWVPGNLGAAALLLYACRQAGLSWEELGLRRDRLGRGLVVGLVAAVLIAGVLGVGLAIPLSEGFLEDDTVADASTWERVFRPLVRIPLGTVVFEELLFRGALLALALRRLNVRDAALVASLAFGLWHILPAIESVSGSWLAVAGGVVGTIIATGLAGIVFCWLRFRANSLLAPVLAHIATNSFSWVAAIVAIEVV